jgi:hypothetical protein
MITKLLNILLFLTFLFHSSSVFARGSFVQNSGRIKANLVVSFQYNEQNPDEWKPLFERANELLYNATEGQVQLGKIDVYVNQNLDIADVLIASNEGKASANPGGYIGNYGHIYINQRHKIQDRDNQKGYFGLVHEFGHYGFFLYDEYIGNIYEGGPTGSLLCEKCQRDYIYNIDDNGTTASIMDGGTTVRYSNRRTEFSISSNHIFPFYNDDGDYVVLYQNVINTDESDWDTIERVLTSAGITITKPANVPITSLPSGLENIEWIPHYGVKQVLCIDRSGSMTSNNRIALAKTGANLYVDLLEEHDLISVTSYASSASVNYSLTEITSTNENVVKTTAKSRINSINASGNTAIGYGLNTSISQIQSQPEISGKEAILLLSDGWHNTGPHPSNYYNTIKNRGVNVYTVALGAGSDANLMTAIADETGGNYYYARYAWELPSIFANIYSIIHDNNLLAFTTNIINAGISFIDRTQIDPFVDTVKFIISWEGNVIPKFEIITPQGERIQEGTNTTNIKYLSGANYKFFVILNPQIGQWEMEVSNESSSLPINYNISAITKDEGIQFNVKPNKYVFTYPEAVHLKAEVIANKPVDGAIVRGFITRPDGSQTSIILYDDGAIEHGDDLPYDGIYSNYFRSYIESGSYVFNIEVANENGFEMYRSDGSEQSDEPPIPVPPFVRVANFSIVVNDVPQINDGKIDGNGYVLLDNNNNFRGYFKIICESYNGIKNGQMMFRHYGPTYGKVYADSQSIESITFSPDGKSATVSGACNLNGISGYRFSLEVTDNGSPGAQTDTAKIIITGPNNYYFSMGEFLTGGEIIISVY